ncbi:MAG TPA: competence protein TfoX [Bacteroidales bacterium]|nr:MAG: hypothetical protein A2X11_14740 [Bacteroidetes bacterium GWE2_42_24]OFY31606.1 MAG: hypothetical protein A2X09_08480 [Bacteroidetes bacterium GWF2_43_11]HAQ64413.1 competence protein TfoX [Bacteroidales bacterium]HBZ67137.1 competence protein TfoX [Bacteroidales bacterium]
MSPSKQPLALQSLPNIGTQTARQLREAGINTGQQLQETGTEAAFLRIKTIHPDACLCKLMAIDGAIKGIRWHLLPPERKAFLKEFYGQLK